MSDGMDDPRLARLRQVASAYAMQRSGPCQQHAADLEWAMAEIARLREQFEMAAERIAAQSELLAKRAERRLKLFVAGSSSGNPNDWSSFGTRAIVLAESLDQAINMVDFSSGGAEIQCDEPCVLCVESPD